MEKENNKDGTQSKTKQTKVKRSAGREAIITNIQKVKDE